MKQFLYTCLFFTSCYSTSFCQTYTFPDETETHEGTWLQWPHHYEYGATYRNENDATWVAMTAALQANEKVHIIAYNSAQQTRITSLLTAASVPLTNVDFKLFQTNDVWVRDNGPIYVRNSSGNLVIEDWGFNGWGGDYGYLKCDPIPTSIATATSTTVLNLNNTLKVEGGGWELDGAGTFLATRTSILSQANPTTPTGVLSIRNLGKTQAQVEALFTQYLGATKFIWLNGWFDTDDITEAHIDGFAKFAPGNKLVTMNNADMLYWGATQADINTLYAASDVNNVVYTKVYVPLTQNNVSKTNGTNLGYKGSYINYYVANNKVLIPNYNDPNDVVANGIIGALYPGRTVVGIDVRNLYGNGGMVHCVTQQQPLATAPLPIELLDFKGTCITQPTLEWSTAMENNNDKFEIEKSKDGNVFEKIGTVKGKLNSSVIQKYTYIDGATSEKIAYYRLKQIDIDAKFQYSKIISVACNTMTSDVEVVPNPSNDFIQLSENNNDYEIQIVNINGQIVMTLPRTAYKDKIEIKDLPNGVYFIQLKNQITQQSKVIKFVKNK